MSFNKTENDNSGNTTRKQPLAGGEDRIASDNNFTILSSAFLNPSADQQVEGGETIDQGGYGLSASGGDQFAKENQTGQGFSSSHEVRSDVGQLQPSTQAAKSTNRLAEAS